MSGSSAVVELQINEGETACGLPLTDVTFDSAGYPLNPFLGDIPKEKSHFSWQHSMIVLAE